MKALGAQAILAQASWVGVRLMIGYRAIASGADPVFLGLVASSFALPALVSAIPAGRFADKFGGTRMSFIGLLCAAGGTAFMLTVSNLGFLLVASVVIGFGHLMVMVGQQTFVAHASKSKSSDSAFGSLTAASSIGQMIGPPVVTAFASLGSLGPATPNTDLGLLCCLGFTLLATPAFFFLRSHDAELRLERQKVAQARTRMTQLYKLPGLWRSMVVSAAVLVTVDLMYAFVPVWATERGVGAATVGLLLALRAGVSVLSRLGLNRLVKNFGRKSLLLISIILAIISLVALPFVGAVGAIGVMIGLGIGLGIPQPLTMAWVVALTPPADHGVALGLRLMLNRLGQISLPLSVGALAVPFGVLGIFWANAALLASAVVIVAGANPDGTDRPTEES